MGIGSARGEGRAVQAAGKAINSPLLEASMDGAHGVLLSVAGGSDLGLFEINEAASLVQEAAHPDANIIFGTVIDDSLGDEVRVTVIAAGFDSGTPTHKKLDPAAFRPRPEGVSGPTSPRMAPRPPAGDAGMNGGSRPSPGMSSVSSTPPAPPAPSRPTPTTAPPTIPPQSSPPRASHTAATAPPLSSPLSSPPAGARTVVDFDDDEVDVPPFMRR
jgi:cell division protein FtsZ